MREGEIWFEGETYHTATIFGWSSHIGPIHRPQELVGWRNWTVGNNKISSKNARAYISFEKGIERKISSPPKDLILA